MILKYNFIPKIVLFTCLFISQGSTEASIFKKEMSQKKGFPKWDGLVYLQNAGLPTPKGIFIEPYSQSITEKTNFFTSNACSDLIALRPDGVNGIGATPPGISFKKNEKTKIVEKLKEWSNKGYGVTLVETHNRFDYDFCCNTLLSEEGDFVVEFVGPGFDGGDLNKSILKPTITIKNKSESPVFIYSDPVSKKPNIESLERLWSRVDIERRKPTKEEVGIRLNYIMKKLLPDKGIKIEKTIVATKEWLKKNKCARLLEEINPRKIVSLDDIKKIAYSASIYSHYLKQKGEKLDAKALTAHKYDGKIVFFGTYDAQKWGKL